MKYKLTLKDTSLIEKAYGKKPKAEHLLVIMNDLELAAKLLARQQEIYLIDGETEEISFDALGNTLRVLNDILENNYQFDQFVIGRTAENLTNIMHEQN